MIFVWPSQGQCERRREARGEPKNFEEKKQHILRENKQRNEDTLQYHTARRGELLPQVLIYLPNQLYIIAP